MHYYHPILGEYSNSKEYLLVTVTTGIVRLECLQELSDAHLRGVGCGLTTPIH